MNDSGEFRSRDDSVHPVYCQNLHASDWEQFARDIEPLRPKLERCVAWLTGDWDESQSIVQETFQRAGLQRQQLQDGTAVYPWLRGIAVNLSKQFLERRSRHAQPTDLQAAETTEPGFTSQQPGALTEILKDELSTKLWLAIGQLPKAYREALVLHYVDGMDYIQMSELLGVSVGALRARAMRARQLLRGSLGRVVDTWMRPSNDAGTERP